MDKLKIYLNERIFCTVDKNEFNYMKEHNIIKAKESLYFIEQNSDFFYLFNDKTTDYKKRQYILQLSKQNFKCSKCGKEHSYNISPFINSKNEVDFTKIICCCKECRKTKLIKRKILKPIYNQKINWEKEFIKIEENFKKYNIKSKYKKDYKIICKEILILERYTNLVLPIRDLSKFKEFDKKINLRNKEQKKRCKAELYSNFNNKCPICGKEVEYNNFTIDHIIAKKLGGKDNMNNFIGMCENCNKEKDSKSVLEFLCEKELYNVPNLLIYIAKIQQEKAKKELTYLKNKKKNMELNIKFKKYLL